MELTILKILEPLAKHYGVQIFSYHEKNNVVGFFRAPNQISLNFEKKDVDQILETFFHEVGHYYCHTNNIFPIYHKGGVLDKYYGATALRAERWVDSWGKVECQRVFPEVKWHDSYVSEWAVRRLREDIANYRTYVIELRHFHNKAKEAGIDYSTKLGRELAYNTFRSEAEKVLEAKRKYHAEE